MKRILLSFLFLSLCSASFATTIVLKDGSTVEGTILERTDNSIKMDMNGFSVTYYNDEIQRVEEDSVAEVPVKAEAPLEVVAETPEVNLPVSSTSSGLAKDELIVKFMDVFGTKATMRSNFDQMANAMPPDLAKKFKDAINVDDIIKELVPLYGRYFTQEELRAYVDFYSSAAGQKLVKSIPLIMKDSITISEKYFDEHLPAEFKEPPAPEAAK